MSEELEQNDGTWSGLKKTLVGTISTVILGAGTWVGTTLFGGNDKEEAAPVQQAAPVINLNLENNNTQTQSSGGTKIIERVVEKPVDKPKPVRKKEGDEFKEKEPQW
jgi:hypothetical protein